MFNVECSWFFGVRRQAPSTLVLEIIATAEAHTPRAAAARRRPPADDWLDVAIAKSGESFRLSRAREWMSQIKKKGELVFPFGSLQGHL